MRVILYARVSTDAQERDGTSLETQERACRDFAKANGWTVVDTIRDSASGFSLDRPGIDRIRRQLRDRHVDVVIAYAVDRLSRNQNHIGVLFDEAQTAGVRLEFVTEKFEDTAIGRFILAARAFIAEVEREKIAERTMRGKAERARSGRIPQGTGKGCYGYRYDRQTGRREIDPEQIAVVQRIFDEFCRNGSCHGIARDLARDGIPAQGGGLWHPLTVRRILENETYTGRTIYRRLQVTTTRDARSGKKRRVVTERDANEWIEVADATPAIISQEQFAKVQEILQDPDRRLRGRPSHQYRLRGYLRCLNCGTPMVGHAQQRGRYLYYRCRRVSGGYVEGKCDARSVQVEVLERVVREEVARALSDPERLLDEARRAAESTTETQRIEEVQKELQRIEAEQTRLARLYTSGMLPEDILTAEGKRLSGLRQRFEAELHVLTAQNIVGLNLREIERRLPVAAERVHSWVLQASADDLALMLEALKLQIQANHVEVRIEGVLPLVSNEIVDQNGQNYVTTARTWASLHGGA
ncbi:MAG: recombinase family protein [Chloroflexi bacterium]|nr:recombinase family protein [Chloroflexota bacterium]